MTVHFLEPPREGDVTIATTVERSGRSLTTITAGMHQEGRQIALAVGAFSTARDPGIRFNDLRMPEVAPADDVPVRTFDPATAPVFAGNFEVRPAIGAEPWSGNEHEPATGGWLRLKHDEPIDHPQLAMLTDAWIPAIFSRLTTLMAVPTIDLTIHFREPLSPDETGPVLVRFTTNVVADGFLEEDGEIWSADGRLLAQSRQLALVLPVNASSTSARQSNHS